MHVIEDHKICEPFAYGTGNGHLILTSSAVEEEGRATGKGFREGSEDPLQQLWPNSCHHGTRGATLHPSDAGPTPQAPLAGASHLSRPAHRAGQVSGVGAVHQAHKRADAGLDRGLLSAELGGAAGPLASASPAALRALGSRDEHPARWLARRHANFESGERAAQVAGETAASDGLG